jgi:hypothetical protein
MRISPSREGEGRELEARRLRQPLGGSHDEELADDRELPSRGETRPVKRLFSLCAYEVS